MSYAEMQAFQETGLVPVPIDHPEYNNDCPICGEPLTNPVRIVSCRHVFCRRCIWAWLVHANTCPNCRRRLFWRPIPNGQEDPAAPVRLWRPEDPPVLNGGSPNRPCAFSFVAGLVGWARYSDGLRASVRIGEHSMVRITGVSILHPEVRGVPEIEVDWEYSHNRTDFPHLTEQMVSKAKALEDAIKELQGQGFLGGPFDGSALGELFVDGELMVPQIFTAARETIRQAQRLRVLTAAEIGVLRLVVRKFCEEEVHQLHNALYASEVLEAELEDSFRNHLVEAWTVLIGPLPRDDQSFGLELGAAIAGLVHTAVLTCTSRARVYQIGGFADHYNLPLGWFRGQWELQLQ